MIDKVKHAKQSDTALISNATRSLRLLTLQGNGAGHLDCNTLTSLLLLNADIIYKRHGVSEETGLEVHIIDCPILDKVRLHGEVAHSLDVDGPALMSRLSWL
jgi:hypothetical protein